MTCVSNSEIEVFKMRGRRAAFIYPACFEIRILLPFPPSFLALFFLVPSPPTWGLSFESSSYWSLVNFSFSPVCSASSSLTALHRIVSFARFVLLSSLFFLSFIHTDLSLKRRTATSIVFHCCLSFLLSSVNFVFCEPRKQWVQLLLDYFREIIYWFFFVYCFREIEVFRIFELPISLL